MMARKRRQQVYVRQRKDRGKPQVIWFKADGRERRRVFDTEEAAHAFAAQVSREIAIGAPPAEDRDTKLKPYAEAWLESRKGEIAPRTLATYRENLTRYVLPVLSHLRLREIRRGHVLALVRGMRVNGYAQNTVRLAQAALSAVLTAALDGEIVDTNVCLNLNRGKRGQAGLRQPRKVRAMNFEHREIFNATAFLRPLLGPYFILGTETGYRPTEGLALTPGDVDLAGRTLRIERNLEKDGTPRPTKTYETRTVELSTLAVTVLRHHLAWLTAEAERRKWPESLWLFPSAQNTPLDYSRMADDYRATLKAAGLAGLCFTPYTMRHTFAALRLSAGAPPKWVSGQLGHRNLTTTLRFYDEWIPKKGETYADILDSKILEPGASAIPEPDSRTRAQYGPDLDSELADLTGGKPGAGGGSRTRDLLITNQLLCH
jgi:integrase